LSPGWLPEFGDHENGREINRREITDRQETISQDTEEENSYHDQGRHDGTPDKKRWDVHGVFFWSALVESEVLISTRAPG